MNSIYSKIISFFIITSILVVTLSNFNIFYIPTFTSLYGYIVCVALLIIYVGIYFIIKQPSIKIFYNISLICCFTWLIYIIINCFILNSSSLSIYYFSACFFLFFCLIVVLQKGKNHQNFLFQIIISLAVLEAIICLLQYFKIIDSRNTLFLVTGTWINPNVTAMFLALAFPIGVCFLDNSKYKKLFIALLLLLFVTILLLQCRTAIIGIGISSFIQLNYRYNIISWLLNKKNRIAGLILIFIALSLILKLGISLYHTKKASADGRRLIWKVATEMIKEKPLLGYGYGNFERNYNLAQANYIKNGRATISELEKAGPVNMAYNELLQNTVDGGLVGLLFLIICLVSLIYSGFSKSTFSFAIKERKDKELITSCAAVVSFATMAMVNFTMQAIPVMCLFIIYCSIIASFHISEYTFIKSTNYKVVNYLLGFSLMLISAFTIYKISNIAYADLTNKKANQLLKQGHKNEALNTIASIGDELKNDSNYWRNFANIQASLGNDSIALTLLKKAKENTSSPDVYAKAGFSYNRLKQYSNAVIEYQQAINLHPTRFAYRNALMNSYQELGDRTKVIVVAKDIIALKPKIPSAQVNRYKNAAKNLLLQMNVLQNVSIKNQNVIYQSN